MASLCTGGLTVRYAEWAENLENFKRPAKKDLIYQS
jgi:hypothetical protein